LAQFQVLAEQGWDRSHRDCAHDGVRHGLDGRNLQTLGSLEVPPQVTIERTIADRKITAWATGYQSDQTVSYPAKTMVMQGGRIGHRLKPETIWTIRLVVQGMGFPVYSLIGSRL
jgi:hypothetical protein